MNKQEYINKWIEKINESMSSDNKYKFKNNIFQCDCKHDKFYLYQSMLICSNCFTEYCIPYDCSVERV